MDAIAQLNAALTARYEIIREIGAGGMATVYLARDIRHSRNVALKVLNPELGAVLGAERFLSEIRVTANLQHPNILPLFDSGEADGLLFYVMPVVAGETLRGKMQRERQLSVDEAVSIACDVASALDYAHRHDVIHRDLKPENILMHEGKPLVADFGIALAVSNAGGARITQTGISLGTPQYMSPEQATGDRALDGRTDIYSLGAVLFEMLVGEPPHTGATAQAIIARMLIEEPRSVRSQRSAVPERVDYAVERALEKLAADRWPTGKQFADALEGKVGLPHHSMRHPARRSRGRTLAIAGAGAAVVALAIAGAYFAGAASGRRAITPSSEPARFPLTFGADKIANSALSTVAISRDGRLLVAEVFAAATNQRTLVLRTLNDPNHRLLDGTAGAEGPFFSPDGKWIGYFAGRRLMKIAVEGGTPAVIGERTLGGSVGGATWLTEDQVVVQLKSRLAVIPAAGGSPRVFTDLDKSRGEVEQRFPLALPDGNTVLYASSPGSLGMSHIGIATLSDGKTKTLDLDGTNPLGVIDGKLIYIGVTGTLMAVPFDVGARELTGAPVTLPEKLFLGPRGSATASMSQNGTLVYQSGSAAMSIVIASPDGKERVLVADPRPYAYPRLSPDGKRLAVSVLAEGRSDTWIYSISDQTLTRMTNEGTANERSEWSPDGSKIIYRSDNGGGSSLWQMPADGSSPASPLYAPKGVDVWEGVISPDGQYLVYRTGAIGTGNIYYRKLSGDTTQHPVAVTPFSEWQMRLSPDGHWIAYASDESGIYQVYVQPFPGPGARVLITADGGEMPVWSRDGRRLYFLAAREIDAADLSFARGVSVLRRTRVANGDFLPLNRGHASYDVTPDVRGLIIPKPVGESQTLVVVNWLDELRAATKRPGR